MILSKKLLKYEKISHGFFNKIGGKSLGIYKSLNCGPGSKDKKSKIKENLKIAKNKISKKSKSIFLLHQIHSNKFVFINKNFKFKRKRIKADAVITDQRKLPVAVLTADCVPILLFDSKKNIVAAIHAGWKGALKGIIENTVKKIIDLNSKNEIYAAIGPCIGKNSYEVKVKFYKEFLKSDKDSEIFFNRRNEDKFLFDLRGYVNYRLKKLDVHNLDNIEMDTYLEKKNFFSFRRSIHLKEKDYGRCISTICLKT